MDKKIVTCHKCKRQTSFYRKFRNENGDWVYECLSHPKAEKLKEQTEHAAKLEKFYQAVHKKFNGICQETHKQLSYSNKHAAHILPKSKYDYFEFDLRNGILLSWSIHSVVDKGSPEQRKQLKVWKRIQDTRRKLLDEVGMAFDEKHWEIVTY